MSRRSCHVHHICHVCLSCLSVALFYLQDAYFILTIVIVLIIIVLGLLQYPVEAHANHTNMATKVFECDYLLPGDFRKDVQEVMHQVGFCFAQRMNCSFICIWKLILRLKSFNSLHFYKITILGDFWKTCNEIYFFITHLNYLYCIFINMSMT